MLRVLRTLRAKMASFIYSLDKSSKKFVCPSCAKKRFVRYVNTSTNDFLNETDGRCDRETSCGYHKFPSKNETITTQRLESKIIMPSFIELSLVTQSLKKYDSNNLIKFLEKQFTKEEIQICIDKYKIGTSKHWDGSTVFWQIDQSNKVHTGKIMLYDENNGKRIKEPFSHIHWVHKKINKPKYQLNQCLFGLHLVKNKLESAPQNSVSDPLFKTIAITESEKTAIIMSIFLPDYTWLATGGKQNLKLQLLQPLKNESIVAFPDKGEYEDWNRKIVEFQKLGFTIKCSSLVEKSDFEIGTDLADIYFKKKRCKSTTMEEKVVFTETEIKIQKLSKINPILMTLIMTFDLLDKNRNSINLDNFLNS